MAPRQLFPLSPQEKNQLQIKEIKPGSGTKCAEAVEGSSQQSDFGNRELGTDLQGKATKDDHGKDRREFWSVRAVGGKGSEITCWPCPWNFPVGAG